MATVPPAGNVYIDGLLYAGRRWDSNRITYSFWSDESLDDAFGDTSRKNIAWLGYEIRAMQLALQAWSNVANINLVKTAGNNGRANIGLLSVDNSDLGGDLGAFVPPGFYGEGTGYFNYQGDGWSRSGLRPGGLGFVTILHELGHGLGLAHPHDNDDGSRFFPGLSAASDPFEDTGRYGLNQGVWTTMTYIDGLAANNFSGTNYGYQSTPMTLDIAAIQHLYGANMSHNTGGDTYVLPAGNGPGTRYFAIWDAGGYDTISAASARHGATINLNSAPLVGPNAGGYLSSVEGIYGGATIANGVVIEKAVGGLGNDRLIGNQVDNSILGKSGNDVMVGQGGKDELFGEQGNDQLIGGVGGDILVGGLGNDHLIGNQGKDFLNGGSGQNILRGGSGQDVFYFGSLDRAVDSLLDFNTAKDSLVIKRDAFRLPLRKGILGRAYFTVGARASDRGDRFIYNRQSGMLFFDADGVGGSAQFGLARFVNRPNLTHRDFVLV
ncbi:MAG: M10 family metallopeptidase [Cyanobacteria bacterium P01_A01_bin.135]